VTEGMSEVSDHLEHIKTVLRLNAARRCSMNRIEAMETRGTTSRREAGNAPGCRAAAQSPKWADARKTILFTIVLETLKKLLGFGS
jgi:hypothetical protein